MLCKTKKIFIPIITSIFQQLTNKHTKTLNIDDYKGNGKFDENVFPKHKRPLPWGLHVPEDGGWGAARAQQVSTTQSPGTCGEAKRSLLPNPQNLMASFA